MRKTLTRARQQSQRPHATGDSMVRARVCRGDTGLSSRHSCPPLLEGEKNNKENMITYCYINRINPASISLFSFMNENERTDLWIHRTA